MALQRFISRRRAREWRKRNSPAAQNNVEQLRPRPAEHPSARDAVDQLRIVMNADFAARPLLNQSEARVFEALSEIVLRVRPEWRVMAQVSLGEILRSKDSHAFRCINAKRLDFLLVDQLCLPQLAIEYQGGGHYQGTAAARDAVKKEALRRAGIGYLEVVEGKTTPTELRQLVEGLISKRDVPAR
jgi:hypothetical protein